MNADLHTRARDLLLADGAAHIEDDRWLQEHLATCPDCSAFLERAQSVRSAFHSLPLTADPAMVEATKQRALRYAIELGEHESRRRMLFVSIAVATGFAWLTVPLLWQGSVWIGGLTATPEAAAVMVFFTAGIVPALLAAAVAMALRNGSHAMHLDPLGRR